MRVGVKFCGNCNPYVDMPALLALLAADAPDIEFLGWADATGYDILLIMSSCPADCATRPLFSGPTLVVTSEAVERWPTEEAALPAAIRAALQKIADKRR